jgi:hypothetical protein
MNPAPSEINMVCTVKLPINFPTKYPPVEPIGIDSHILATPLVEITDLQFGQINGLELLKVSLCQTVLKNGITLVQ